MTKQTIELDQHRGMAAQKATEIRRLMRRSRLMSERCVCGRMNWKCNCRRTGGDLA
jgi:hypothetical protein